MLMEVRLLHLAIGEWDLLLHVAHALHHAAKPHALGSLRIDDLAAYVAGGPDVVHLDLVVFVYGDVGHFGKIALVAEVAGDAHGSAGVPLSISPVWCLR